MSRPRDESAKQRILDAAAELLRAGGPGFSMADVAARAGVSRGTVYRWFGSRAELRDALVAERGLDPADLAGVRERILDAASQLISSRGLADMTIEHVAGEAGVAAMTIYRHFGDRMGLVRAYAAERTPRRMASTLELASGPDIEADLTGFITYALRFVASNPDLMRIQLSPRGDEAELAAELRRGPHTSRDALRHYLQRQRDRGRLAGDPRQLAAALFGMVMGVALSDREAALAAPRDAARAIVRLFLDGCRDRDAAPDTPRQQTRKRRSR